MIIDGKSIANDIIQELKGFPRPEKFLAAFLVGDNPASISFLKQKEGVAKELGLDFRLYKFPVEISQDKLREEILKIVEHKTCGGAIVQLPLPEHISKQYVLNAIPREKDVDVLGERALGAFYAGRNPVLPPAVGVVEKILQATSYSLQAKRVAVLGLGSLIGKPIANWLMGKTKEVYLLDEGSDLALLKEADLIISGVGKANLFSAENLKENTLVIDFGYDMSGGKISGDFDFSKLKIENCKLKIDFTPTPGGTGPILVAKLFENFYRLNQN